MLIHMWPSCVIVQVKHANNWVYLLPKSIASLNALSFYEHDPVFWCAGQVASYTFHMQLPSLLYEPARFIPSLLADSYIMFDDTLRMLTKRVSGRLLQSLFQGWFFWGRGVLHGSAQTPANSFPPCQHLYYHHSSHQQRVQPLHSLAHHQCSSSPLH